MKPVKSAVKYSPFAAEECKEKLNKLGDPLKEIDWLIDFVSLAEEIDKVAPRPDPAKGGRSLYPTELMIRILVLQQFYNLLDDAMEYQILDRYSFQRFCELEDFSSIPDSKTLWVFNGSMFKEVERCYLIMSNSK